MLEGVLDHVNALCVTWNRDFHSAGSENAYDPMMAVSAITDFYSPLSTWKTEKQKKKKKKMAHWLALFRFCFVLFFRIIEVQLTKL